MIQISDTEAFYGLKYNHQYSTQKKYQILKRANKLLFYEFDSYLQHCSPRGEQTLLRAKSHITCKVAQILYINILEHQRKHFESMQLNFNLQHDTSQGLPMI